MKSNTQWGAQCQDLRSQFRLTQQQLAEALSGRDAASRCSVASVRDWEQGRSEPPGWVQYLILGVLMRKSLRPPRRTPVRKRRSNSSKI